MADYLIRKETLEQIGDAVRTVRRYSDNHLIDVPNISQEIKELYDTDDATAAASDIIEGRTAYIDGGKVTGTIATKTSSNLTANGATVTVPAGYYATNATKSVTTVTQATPSISINSSGLITATATQTAGYVSAGTRSGTEQLKPVQAATTYTPGTSNQTIAKGTYLTGDQTIKGDVDLVPEHIRYGKEIFGVYGTCGDIVSRTVTARVLDQTFPNPTNAFAYYTSTSASTWNIQINGTSVWSTSSTNTNLKIICVGSWLIITNNAADRLVLFTDNIDYPIQSVRISSNISINHALYYIS